MKFQREKQSVKKIEMMIPDEERSALSDDQLTQMSKDELIKSYKELQKYTDTLQVKYQQNDRAKSIEIAKLKNIILMRHLSSKEQEQNVKI